MYLKYTYNVHAIYTVNSGKLDKWCVFFANDKWHPSPVYTMNNVKQ